MNKTELITFLRDPNRLSSEQLEELEAIVNDNPYFLSARLLLAKASKEQGHPKTKKRIASAAIYSTDRVLLKKYLNGNLFFLSQPPKAEEEVQSEIKQAAGVAEKESTKISIRKKEEPVIPKEKTIPSSEKISSSKIAEQKRETSKQDQKPPNIAAPVASDKKERTDKRPSALNKKVEKSLPKVPELPSGELDSILEELQQDIANLKVSREKFSEVQQKIEEDDAVSAALQKASTPVTSDSKTESPTSPEIKEPEKQEEKEDEAKKAASQITMQILEAAKKAKEEVNEEDKAIKDEVELKEQTSDSSRDEQVGKQEADNDKEIEAKENSESLSDSSNKEKKDKDASSDDSERAERVIREPRFSRFSTRSYLKPPENIDPAGFLDDSKEKEKPKEEDSDSKKKESSSDIKLPDLSKAKPVPRRSKKSSKKEKVEDSKDLVSKKESPKEDKPSKKKSVVREKKKDELTEEKVTPKKKTSTKTAKKKPSEKKVTEKKTTTKKKVASKKESTKKAKSKPASETKSDTKKNEKKDDDKSDRKAQKDIIDKFIKESPSIKYQRKENPTAEDLAEQSAAWDPNLASEYLAEIYLQQGNKKRAIEIYEALSLKYPEKKSYFADLISKIE